MPTWEIFAGTLYLNDSTYECHKVIALPDRSSSPQSVDALLQATLGGLLVYHARHFEDGTLGTQYATPVPDFKANYTPLSETE